ncbi:MAG: GDSL-type esterase/lipase family protein [Actinomycetales bacterium]
MLDFVQARIAQVITLVRDSAAARRILTFVVGLIALLVAANNGASRLRVQIFLILFVIVSTLWIRGEYVADRERHPQTLPWWVGAGMASGGLVMLGVFWKLHADGLGLYGVIAVYLGTGSLVMLWRDLAPGAANLNLRIGVVLLAVGGLSFVLGALLLGRAPVLVGGLLLGTALLGFVPLGLSVAAALLMSKLNPPGPSAIAPAVAWSAVAGAGVFVLGSLAAAAWARSPWLLLAMGAIGLLMVAQASPTQADIVAIVAILALMGVTPTGAKKPDEPAGQAGDKVLVALGDSYMSGEGASVYFRGTDDGGGDECRRSPTSWAVLASQQRPFTGLVDLACSGAVTRNVQHDPEVASHPDLAESHLAQAGEHFTQLDQYARLPVTSEQTYHPALVAVTVGGNDAGFSTVGIMCVAPGNCDEKSGLWLMSLPQVKEQLETTYTEIGAEFPNTPVVVTAYPNPIFDAPDCGDLALSLTERTFIRRFVSMLNQDIHEAADDHGFYYLSDMANALSDSNLQLCDPDNEGHPGINFIGLRSVNGPAEQRFNPQRWAHSSFHPNELGHAAMLKAFEKWLATVNPTQLFATPRTPKASLAIPPDTTTTSTKSTICRAYDSNEGKANCRTTANSWAEGQVGHVLFPKGILGLLAALGAWWASVVYFAWRRT